MGRRWLVAGSEIRIVARRRVVGSFVKEEEEEETATAEALLVEDIKEDWPCGKEECTGPGWGMGLLTCAGMGCARV